MLKTVFEMCFVSLSLCQVFGVGVQGGSVKDVHRKDSDLIFPHIQSINLTQTQVCVLHVDMLLCALCA